MVKGMMKEANSKIIDGRVVYDVMPEMGFAEDGAPPELVTTLRCGPVLIVCLYYTGTDSTWAHVKHIEERSYSNIYRMIKVAMPGLVGGCAYSEDYGYFSVSVPGRNTEILLRRVHEVLKVLNWS